MSSLFLRVFFHGLIAFVPQPNASQATSLTALLVNAVKVPMNASYCVTSHKANVTFLYDPTACRESGCSPDNQDVNRCSCPLQGLKKISLSSLPDKNSVAQPLNGPTPHSMPANSTEADSFSYLINLNRWNLTLDPRFLSSSPPADLVGRFDFPFTHLHACSLAQVAAAGTELVRSFGLGPLGSAPSGTMQAVAQGLAADIDLAGESSVTLSLTDVGTGTVRSFTLQSQSNCGSSGPCIMLWVDNERPSDIADPACNDGVGRDFAFLSALVGNPPPAWDARLLPKADLSSGVDPASIMTDVCDHIMHGPTSRPVCAMAVIN
jgi:hypothetical protein